MAIGSDDLATKPGEQTRRALLAKAGVLSGGVGLVALSRADRAAAIHPPPTPPPPAGGNVKVNNVKDWGAIGDDAHNDQPYIQQCIDDSAGTAAVYLPPGTYRLTTVVPGFAYALGLPSDTILFGSGRVSVLKADPAGTLAVVINSEGNAPESNIRVEDLVVDCNGKVRANAVKVPGTAATPAREVFLRRVEVKNLTDQTVDTAVLMKYGKDSAIEDCYVHHVQKDGIFVRGEGVVVSGNVVEDCGDDHLIAAGGENTVPDGRGKGGVTVVGNMVNANTSTVGSGIRLVKRVTATGNVIFGGVRAGIDLRGSPIQDEGPKQIVVANNVVLEAGNTSGTAQTGEPFWGAPQGSGISLHLQGGLNEADGILDVDISNNVILKPRSNGIMFAHGNQNLSIRNVSVSGNVILMDEPTDLVFDNSGLARRGIAFRGTSDSGDPLGPIRAVRILGNQIINAKGEGIYAKGNLIDKLDIHQNTIVASGTPGTPYPAMRLDGISTCSIVANRAYDEGTGSQNYGLHITNCTGTVIIVGNDLFDNGVGPVLYQATTAGPARLRIRDNPGYNPWAGQGVTNGSWTSFVPYTGGPTFFRSDVEVSFGAPFPSGTTPKVVAIPRAEGFCVSVIAGATPHATQTLRVWVPASIDPGSGTVETVNWIAEPMD